MTPAQIITKRIDELRKDISVSAWRSVVIRELETILKSLPEAYSKGDMIKHFEDFYFEMGEDYNLWDEEIEPYPAQRILDAMKKKLDELKAPPKQ